jgi:flagellar L-ring protein FlgH
MSRKRRTRAAALALSFLLAAGPAAFAQAVPSASLWNDNLGSRYGNHKAMHVGDLLTVLVMESTQGSNRSSLKTKKESKVNAEGGPGAGSLAFLRLFQVKSDIKDELDGNGQSTLSGSLVAKIAASVTEVRGNGQMVIEGSRLISVNGQDDRITLHGVARPEDIRADNTILSTNLAEARISYDGKGAVKNAARRGVILRILSWFF